MQGRQPQDVQEVWPKAKSSKHSGRAQPAKEAAIIEEQPGEAEGHRLTQEAVAEKQKVQQERAEAEARFMEQIMKQVQDNARVTQKLKMQVGAGARADPEGPQVEVGTAAGLEGTVVSTTEAADGCMHGKEEGAQAWQVAQLQVFKKVASRAKVIKAMEEQRALVHMVQEQVLQQQGVEAQALQTVKEGMVAAKRQQVKQGEEKEMLQGYPVMHLQEWWQEADDSGPETTEESESQLGDDPHRMYWVQGKDGLKVTAAGLASEEEVREEVQHVWQEELETQYRLRMLTLLLVCKKAAMWEGAQEEAAEAVAVGGAVGEELEGQQASMATEEGHRDVGSCSGV
jgi:hypothetical protein